MAEEKGVTKYTSRDGQEIALSFENIRNYLVSGNKDKVTQQELIFFMAICKSRGLNPFKKDAYLIKYGDDPAAIVTSIDYFRARAKAQKDCVGWKKGVILKDKDGKVKDSAGLIQDGETLLGGFFEATPAGWKEPFRLEVNLKGYVKKTKEGKVTRFWSEDNQPSQIAKVAESQGLRALWPDEFQGVYEESEIRAGSDIEITAGQNGTYEQPKEPPDTSLFDKFVSEKKYIPEKLAEFINLSANIQGKSEPEIKVMAQEHFEEFWSQFMKWQLKTAPKETEPEKKGKGKAKTEKPSEAEMAPGECPKREGSIMKVEFCNDCKDRPGCPIYPPG